MPRGVPRNQGDVIYVATETFACEVDGSPVIVHAGETRVREGHSLLDTYRQSFKPADSGVHFDVEQATAAPGEKRGGTQSPPVAEPKPAEPKPEPKPKQDAKPGPLTTSDAKKAS